MTPAVSRTLPTPHGIPHLFAMAKVAVMTCVAFTAASADEATNGRSTDTPPPRFDIEPAKAAYLATPGARNGPARPQLHFSPTIN